jgi:transposase
MLPLDQSILQIPGFEIESISDVDPVIIKCRFNGPVQCIHCFSSSLRIKDTFYRWLKHESFGLRRTWLYLRTRKYHCRNCTRYFNDRFPGILPYKRSTEAFRKEVFTKHHDGICQQTLSSRLRIGAATVERWYQSLLALKLSRSSNNPCPPILGIDEHFFTRKQGYATTFCDLKHHKVYDVALGRSEASLKPFLERLMDKSKVKVVVMDLSETYRSIVRKYFPGAKIVTDRFHVIRLINHHFLKTWRLFHPEGYKSRGLLSLMRRNPERLELLQAQRLTRYFSEYPGLAELWNFRNRLITLMKLKMINHGYARRTIPVFLKMLTQLHESPWEPMQTLGKTLQNWDQEIVRMWRFSKSNGITEGFHNKMETISRRAYGFRNFENYRLRVRTLCG